MLISAKELLNTARERHFAIPAANFVDEMSLTSHVAAAERRGLPIILAHAQIHQGRYLSVEEAGEMGLYYAKKANVPAVLHLDHGQSPEMAERAIRAGFNSVMIDASMLPMEENIALTKEVISFAHAREISVEAEIGHVGTGEKYTEDSDTIYTTVAEAEIFVRETGVDSLAVSIGTAHGLYKGTPKISFERLSEIREAVDVPLVLHGGSSSGDENLAKCAALGITKINIYSDFMVAGAKSAAAVSFDKEGTFAVEDYYRYTGALRQGMQQCLDHYFTVFGTQKI